MLRTIGNNIADTANDVGTLTYSVNNTKKTISLLNETTGDMKSTFDVLSNIAKDWQEMSLAEQQAIGITLAGKNQFEVFSAVLSNFETAVNATETAMGSAGSAMRENEAVLESVQGHLSRLKSEFVDFSRNVLSSDFIKGVLDAGTALLKLANSDIGQVIIKVTALTASVKLLSAIMKSPFTLGFRKNIAGIAASIQLLTAANGSLISGLKSLIAIWAKTPFGMATIAVAGISAIIGIIDKFTISASEAKEQLEKTTESINRLTEEKNKLESTDSSKMTESETQRLNIINAQIGALERRKELEEQQSFDKDWFGGAFDFGGKMNELSNAFTKLELSKNKLKNVETQLNSLTMAGDGASKQADKLRAKQVELTNALTTQQGVIAELSQALQKAKDSGLDIGRVGEELLSKSNDLFSSNSDLINSNKDLADSYDDMQGSIQATKEDFEELSGAMSNVSSAYNTLKDAADEYNEYGYITLDTLSKLVTLDAQYLNSLEMVGGKLRVNKGLFDEQTNALKNQFVAMLNSANGANNLANALNNTSSSASVATGAISGAGSAAASAGNQMIGAAQDVIAYAQSLATLANTIAMSFAGLGKIGGLIGQAQNMAFGSMLDKKTNSYKNVFDNIKVEVAKPPSISGGRKKGRGGGGSKKENDPIKEQTELFKEQIDILEHKLFLLEQIDGSEQQRAELAKQIQDKLHEQADWYRRKGLKDTSKEIRDLQKQWYSYTDYRKKLTQDLYNDMISKTQEELDVMSHKIDLLGLKEGVEGQKIIIYREMQEKVHAMAQKFRAMGLSEESEQIRKMQQLWMQYEKSIKGIYDELADAAKKEAEEAERAWEDALNKRIEGLEKQKDAYETAFGYVVDRIQEEIDKLEEQKDKEEKYWDEKIDALKKQNDELNKQIELEKAQQALAEAKARKKLVYKDGIFQYSDDYQAIADAQANLDSLNRQQQLDKDVQALEDAKDKSIAAIDKQIEKWEEYKKAWGSVVDNYKKEQDKLIAEQILGIDFEKDNWKTRLDNLQDFVDDYIDILEELKKAQEEMEQGFNKPELPDKDDRPSGGHGGGSHNITFDPNTDYQSIINKLEKEYARTGNKYILKELARAEASRNAKIDAMGLDWEKTYKYQQYLDKYAKGTMSANGGLSLVGEQGAELRVLNKGDGIIPSNLTKNLMELGRYSISDLFNKFKNVSSETVQNINYNFDKLVLPNVSNANDFISELKNFKTMAIQAGSSR